MQVSQPTNEQPLLQAEVNDLVSRINSKFGSLEYTPVVYLKQVYTAHAGSIGGGTQLE